jgi:UDP-glucose:tetrahydrobiopterin glucosyltransferase
VVLESLACGLPVIAYSAKGPKDIIRDGACGYLVKTEEQMCDKIIAYLDSPQLQKDLREAAVKRAKDYDADGILERFMADVGLSLIKS